MERVNAEGGRPTNPSGPARSALAALATVARTHGVHLSADQLCRDYALDEQPPSAAMLMQIAEDHGLKARTARLAWRDLVRLDQALPVLLRFEDGRCLVLNGVVRKGDAVVARLHDPVAEPGNEVFVDVLRLTDVWRGETLFLKRRIGLMDAEQPFGLGWMVAQILRERRMFRDVCVAALALSFLALAPPILYMVIIDRVLVHQRLSTLVVLVSGVAFVLLFDTAFNYLRRLMIAIASARIDARINIVIFNRLLGLPIDVFERVPTGVIAYKLAEIRRVRTFFTGQLLGTLLDGGTLLVLLPTMFLLNSTLAAYVLSVALVMFVIVTLFLAPMRRAYGRVIEAEHRKNALLIETLHGMRTIKSLALEGRKRREWDSRVAEAVSAATALQHLANTPQTLLNPLEKSIYAGSLAIGAYLMINNAAALHAGTLVAFTMIATRTTQPFVQFASLLQQVQEVHGALRQVASIVNLAPERTRASGARPPIAGSITFSGVRFRYPGQASPALDGVNLSIAAGSLVGVMGRSGSGKTTLTRLLQGLHSEYEGLIKVDGVDLREIELSHLRANMGVVLQDSFLFHGTIRDNIQAARLDASLDDVIRVARLAGAEEFIERLPRGYETMIEEGSCNLSGGQRQRLAIARALLVDPPVLIFDEATSALDPESEGIITTNLRRIAQGRTVIVISHRLASLVDCDQIIVLEAGRLADSGPHADLLRQCDIYRHLWFQQNRQLPGREGHERAQLGRASRA